MVADTASIKFTGGYFCEVETFVLTLVAAEAI